MMELATQKLDLPPEYREAVDDLPRSPQREKIMAAGASSMVRTLYTAVPGRECDVIANVFQEGIEFARKAGFDRVDVLDILSEAANAERFVQTIGLDGIQDAIARGIAEAERVFAQQNDTQQLIADPPSNSRSQVTRKPVRELTIQCAADVSPERISWLWPGRFAIGKLHFVAGEPGLGKSQISIFMAASVSNGGQWPCNEGIAPHGSVILLSAEDSLGDTIRPRLDAAGADVNRVYVLTAVKTIDDGGRRSFDLKADLDLLESQINKLGDVRMVVIDPISAYLGKADSHSNTDVRGVLEPISEMADRMRVSVVAITHLSKGGNGSAQNRFIGSIGFVAASRSAFIVTRDPESDDPARRLFLQAKNNLAPDTGGLVFRVEQSLIGDDPDNQIVASAAVWTDEKVAQSADETLAAIAGAAGDTSSKDDATTFLTKLLAAGPMPVKEIEAEAIGATLLADGKPIGQSRAFKNARKDLGIDPVRVGGIAGGGQWVWGLPTTPKMAADDAKMSKMATLESGHLSNLSHLNRPPSPDSGTLPAAEDAE